MSEDTRSSHAAAEIDRINAFFPIMPSLGNRLAATRPFRNTTIAISAHLTTLTGALLRELTLGGGEWVVCAASGATTDWSVVHLLRDTGISVYTTGSREDGLLQVLDHNPTLIADVGASLMMTVLEKRPEQAKDIKGGVEVTRSGIVRLRESSQLPFPLVNLNNARLKTAIENRRGVGEGFWHAVQSLTGVHLSGRRVGVIGYGPVGHGVASFARSLGATVEVVELDPIRQLIAHYDGYPTPSLADCLSRVKIVVTCTGHSDVVSASMLPSCQEGVVLINAGHGGDEINVPSIRAAAKAIDHVADNVVRYQLSNKKHVVVLGDGHPLNIVTNAGSPEPVLLHFALLGLTLEWLANQNLPNGEVSVPNDIEVEAAKLALQALRVSHG